MITSKEDYKRYVAQDMKALGAKTRHPLIQTDNSMIWLVDPVARYQRLLRRLEYWENRRTSPGWLPLKVLLRWRFQRKSAQLGFSIPLNVCGPGLCIGGADSYLDSGLRRQPQPPPAVVYRIVDGPAALPEGL